MSDRVLKDQIALVTGASRGIGAATALSLADAGAHVVLTARTAAGLEEVEDQIHKAGGTGTIAPLDLTDGESIARLAEAIRQRWGRLDVMVLNAAMLGSLGPVPHSDPNEFSKIFTLNVSAQAAMIRAFDPLLRASASARLFGVTSSVAQTPRAYWGAYAASKAAFETLLLTYAEEQANLARVKVAIIDPGATRTRMRALAYPGEDPASLKEPAVVGLRIAVLASENFSTGLRERVAG